MKWGGDNERGEKGSQGGCPQMWVWSFLTQGGDKEKNKNRDPPAARDSSIKRKWAVLKRGGKGKKGNMRGEKGNDQNLFSVWKGGKNSGGEKKGEWVRMRNDEMRKVATQELDSRKERKGKKQL